jgi:hypothetical protein
MLGGDGKKSVRIFIGSPKGRDHSEDRGLVSRIILKWILRLNMVGFLDLSRSKEVQIISGLL